MHAKTIALLMFAALSGVALLNVYVSTRPNDERKVDNPLDIGRVAPKTVREEKAKQNPEPPRINIDKRNVDGLVARAHDHQKDRNWCEAEKQWTVVLDAIKKAGEPAELDHVRREAEGNIQLLKLLCKPPQLPVKEVKRDPPQQNRPDKINKDNFLKFYP